VPHPGVHWSMTDEQALIVGAGPIGLACAISAKRRGLDPLVIDAGAIANSIVRYPIGMTFFTTPERLEIGGHPLVSAGGKPSREEALMYYRGVVRAEGIRVRTYVRLADAHREDGAITATLESRHGVSTLKTKRLVLATGYFDRPNLLGVPGESRPHVSHYFDEAHRWSGLDVVVIGGKNSAVEATLQLFRAGARVTLVHRGGAFKPSLKYWLRPDIENRVKAGEITAWMGAIVTEIDHDAVTIRGADGAHHRLPADRVFALTGFTPDLALFSRIGITLDTMGKPAIDPLTLETDMPGVHMAGSAVAGRQISEVFIENGRWDGEKIFGDADARRRAQALYEQTPRPLGE